MTEVRRRGRPGQAEPVAQKGAQALERGIAILQYLEKSGGSSSVSDISLNLDLPLSTTFRLLKVLQAADFVYQDSQLGWWHIGLGVFNVGAAYIHNRDVLSVAGPFMRRLMLLSGETVNVAIRNGNEAVLIGQLECKSMVRMCAPLGSRLPLHASGAGKALLYPLAEEELMSIILQTGLQQFTPTTLVDMPTLLKDLEQARELGYTFQRVIERRIAGYAIDVADKIPGHVIGKSGRFILFVQVMPELGKMRDIGVQPFIHFPQRINQTQCNINIVKRAALGE